MFSKKLLLFLLGIVLIFSSTGKFARADEGGADAEEYDEDEYDEEVGEMDKEEEIKLLDNGSLDKHKGYGDQK